MKLTIKVKTKLPVKTTIRNLEKHFDRPLARAAHFMAGVAKEMVRIPYPPSSAPWAPPHLRTGALRQGITSFKVKRLQYVIQASAVKGTHNYAVYLEFGTKRMKPRPFMRPMMLKTYVGINTFFQGAF